MLAHDHGLFFCQRSRLEEDRIRNSHLADVVKERPAAYVDEVRIGHAGCPGEANGELCYALCMALGFPIAEIQSAGPAFNGGIVREHELGVCALEVIEQGRVIERYGSLAGEGPQEFQ